jgi:outer membrane immunogenic protein
MRKLTAIAAATALFGCANVANAADLSFKDTPPAPVWTGLYVGGHFGGLWQGDREHDAEKKGCLLWWCTDWKDAEHVKFDEEDDDATFVGGVHVGYNWQQDASVFGIEADVDFADEIDYLATLRARLGYAAGNLLIYATGGVAFAGFDDGAFNFKTSHHSYSFESDDDDLRVGFVVGGGVEYKLRPNWSVGLEGLYYGFNDDKDEYKVSEYGCWGFCSKHYKVTDEDDNDFWVVRARLSYHFQSEPEMEPLK